MQKTDAFHLTPEVLLRAYAAGIFPMAESADDPTLHWVEPKLRGVIPLNDFHVSSKMRHFVRHHPYRVVMDQDFAAVIDACAAPRHAGGETWINDTIRDLCLSLFELGHAHTVEVRRQTDDALVGGLYGIRLGGAFFGESMFHRETDCSKLALIHLVARLRAGGFKLLDTQFITEHLRQFGAIEIPRAVYRRMLDLAIDQQARLDIWPNDKTPDPDQILAAIRAD